MTKYYFTTATPNRPDFVKNPDETEMAVLGEHFAYFKGLQKDGKAYFAGSAMDQERTYGFYIFTTENEEEVREILENDPAYKKGIQTYSKLAELKNSLHPLQKDYPVGKEMD